MTTSNQRSLRRGAAALALCGAALLVPCATPRAQCELDTLHLSGGQPGDLFGGSVALSGDRAVVGALSYDGPGGVMIGAAAVFERVAPGWHQTALLLAADPHVNGFGATVALAGDIALVGAPSDATLGSSAGAVYVFERVGGAWLQTAKLLPSSAFTVAHTGRALALSGTTAFVGAPHNDGPNGLPGTVFIFDRGPGGWSLSQTLLSPQPGVAGRFGGALAVQGGRAAIGAKAGAGWPGVLTGTAWIAERAGPGPGGWSLVAQLSPGDGQAGDDFGAGIALDGDEVIVGSDEDDDLGTDAGAAYVFDRIAGVWTQTDKLHAAGGQPGEHAARSIALSGERLLFSLDRSALRSIPGGACFFERSAAAGTAGAWQQSAELQASDGVPGDAWGRQVSIAGDTALCGAIHADDLGTDSGAASIVHLGAAPAWTDLGQGLAGVSGVPLLVGTGALCSGGSAGLALGGGRALAPAALVAGLSVGNAPFKGGVLVPTPSWVLVGFATDAAGGLAQAFTLPAGVPSGLALSFQMLVADPAAAHGVALSNAVQIAAP